MQTYNIYISLFLSFPSTGIRIQAPHRTYHDTVPPQIVPPTLIPPDHTHYIFTVPMNHTYVPVEPFHELRPYRTQSSIHVPNVLYGYPMYRIHLYPVYGTNLYTPSPKNVRYTGYGTLGTWVQYFGYMGTVRVRCGKGAVEVLCRHGRWVRHMGTVHGSSTRLRCTGTCDTAGPQPSAVLF